MKISIPWLTELVSLNISVDELVALLPLRTIGTKEVTQDFIELDMKGYNRADLLSLRGVAYEVVAITGSKISFQEPEPSNFAWEQAKLPELQVKIEPPELSTVQCVAKIEGLRVGPSNPAWVKKLEESGMRSVNNIADITNLIMLEYGQPLHSFDAATVKDEAITVRKAEVGEEVITLDGKVRKLQNTDIVLADSEQPIDVGGVMGGKNTEITDSTNTILLSASMFNAQMIRKTGNRLGLHSEASKRFQHGLTKTRLLQAYDAAIKMYQSIGGKLTAISLVGDFTELPRTVKLTQKKVNSLIGVQIPPIEVTNYLEKLSFIASQTGSDPNLEWEVKVPYWRLDIELEEDLIEEVARMYGYEKIPAQPLPGKVSDKVDQSAFELISKIKETLVAAGLTEIQTYSFYSTRILAAMGWYEKDNLNYLVKITNPISAETEYLRLNLWPNLLEVVNKNIRQGFKNLAIFEIGKIYSLTTAGLPQEEYRLSIALMNGTDNPIEELLEVAKQLPTVILTNAVRPESDQVDSGVANAPQNDKKIEIKPNELQGPGLKLFHPTRHVGIFVKGKQIGGVAEVHARLANELGVEQRVAILEINLLQ